MFGTVYEDACVYALHDAVYSGPRLVKDMTCVCVCVFCVCVCVCVCVCAAHCHLTLHFELKYIQLFELFGSSVNKKQTHL